MAEIIATMASFLGPVMEVGKWITVPIKRQFNYLCCLNHNIKCLRDEAQKLKDASDGLQMKVDAAERNAQVIFPQVRTWLESAGHSQDIINGIERDMPLVQKGCLNLTSRYSVSKKAKKIADALRKLCDNCRFEQISQDATPAALESLAYGPMKDFDSRKHIEEDIMEALRDENVNVLGICGMGGVGKTTMAKRIMNRVREQNLFDEVVMVVVSQQADMNKIQRDVAESLGLDLGVESLSARAHRLHTRLKDSKSILMVLDDVWERLKLEDLGIPCQSNSFGRCKVLLTSRDRDILDEMETQKAFGIQILSESEAWFFFREKVGNCIDREDLQCIAESVVKECKGLPVALVTVGGALKNKERRQLWEDALLQLRSSNPIHIPRVLKDVYQPLKLSYDYLEDHCARSLFLLCSMFQEDTNIDLEILTWYGIGLRMYEGIKNLNEARNRVCALVELLKSRFLLLDGDDEDQVKMHDVVRDMASYIASKEENHGFEINLDGKSMDWLREISHKEYAWIAIILGNITELPVALQFPSLRLLMMQQANERRYEFTLPDNFFDGMNEVNVLSLEHIRINSLPPTTQLLENLHTLRLFKCRFLESIKAIGALSNLEILSCWDCERIKELPIEIGRLKHLKLLEIIKCRSLETIVPGMISSLVCLEELKFRSSFDGWQGKNNVALAELESLPNLTCLEIEINDFNSVAEEIRFPSKIVQYHIAIGTFLGHEKTDKFKRIILDIPRQIDMGNWIHILVRGAEQVELRGDGSNINLGGHVEYSHDHIKDLLFRRCSTVKKLVNITLIDSSKIPIFSSLESLYLNDLANLEVIFDGPIPAECNNSFRNLKILKIHQCRSLRYAFSVSMARSLSQLEKLSIVYCGAIEGIFCEDGNSHLCITFPKLRQLQLFHLPQFISICRGVQSIKFPELNDLHIIQLPKLTSLSGSPAGHCDMCLHDFFNEKVVTPSIKKLAVCFFNNLEILQIRSLNGFKSLISSSVARNLASLRQLTVRNCLEMLEVIANDDEEQIPAQLSLFPHLVMLFISNNPKLRSFCQWKHDIELPLLEDVHICRCPQMETFSRGSLITPRVRTIHLNDGSIETEDLNIILQQFNR